MRRYAAYILLLMLPALCLGEIYRYQDDKGRWVYTDKKPQISEYDAVSAKNTNTVTLDIDNFTKVWVPEDLCPVDLARRSNYYRDRGGYLGKQGDFSVINKGTESEPDLYARNDYFLPVELRLKLDVSENVKTLPPLPLTRMVPPQSNVALASIRADNPAFRYRYKYSYFYQLGDPAASHDGGCYYLPPVPAEGEYKISQSFNGSFSHNSAYSRYAVDIAMPEGTPVLAARDGLVIRKNTEYVLAGLEEKYKQRANAISVLHGDGTIAIYAHLQFRSIRFHEGQTVKAGDVIAKSGNTGYSTGPHLHFEVVKNTNMYWQSMPFEFYLGDKIVTPVKGLKLWNQAEAEVLAAKAGGNPPAE